MSLGMAFILRTTLNEKYFVSFEIGDSITAGFGLMGIDGLDTLMEWRGKSFAIGGDPDQITLANFFGHYSPNLTGASLGLHLVELPYSVDHHIPSYLLSILHFSYDVNAHPLCFDKGLLRTG